MHDSPWKRSQKTKRLSWQHCSSFTPAHAMMFEMMRGFDVIVMLKLDPRSCFRSKTAKASASLIKWQGGLLGPYFFRTSKKYDIFGCIYRLLAQFGPRIGPCTMWESADPQSVLLEL